MLLPGHAMIGCLLFEPRANNVVQYRDAGLVITDALSWQSGVTGWLITSMNTGIVDERATFIGIGCAGYC